MVIWYPGVHRCNALPAVCTIRIARPKGRARFGKENGNPDSALPHSAPNFVCQSGLRLKSTLAGRCIRLDSTSISNPCRSRCS